MVVQPDDPRLANVGFVKLEGPGVEFYAKKYEIHIGRRSKSTKTDVVLGDNMNISRHHATIAYDFEQGKWELKVLGKNGVTVDEKICLPGGEPVYLQSGSFLQMGDRSFYFLLPIDEDQLEWGYASDEVPTVGPTRASNPLQPSAPNEMEATSNVSSDALRGPSSSHGGPGQYGTAEGQYVNAEGQYGNAGAQWTVTTGVTPGNAPQDPGWGVPDGDRDVRMEGDDVELSE